jgi:3-hydroxymyristoyl/3-hydroxydecanoyl-(acyl carrier protein) dehydratase/1-acyl-sn-glycerol-3-phosphate acyltransferase
VLHTVVKTKNISRSAGMIIESFDVRCSVNGEVVYELDTVFGFFPPSAFANQAGLPVSDAQRALFERSTDFSVDLTARPGRYCAGSLRLAEPFLLMIDRVTCFDPRGGAEGLGCLRAEKDVDAGEWFFKAHFYQDPVQPGSLGIEAMLQLLQFHMIETGMGDGVAHPRFEAIAVDREHVWKYRGQVVPENVLIGTTMEIVEVGEDERGRYALADTSLWVDGKRIYEAKRLGMRVVAGEPEAPRPSRRGPVGRDGEELLDPATDPWLLDHCPTYTLPALPMMSMVDRMMGAARATLGHLDGQVDGEVDGLTDLSVERWVIVDGPTRLRTEVAAVDGGHEVRLLVWRDANNPALSRFELAARAKVGAPPSFEDLAPLFETASLDPYGHDRLFHGPAFRLLRSLEMGGAGSRGVIDAGAGNVPFGSLNQALLDAATHVIPHDRLDRWSDRISADVVGYPHRLDVRFDGPAPSEGEVVCDARFVGFAPEDAEARFPIFALALRVGERVFARMRLVEILMPKGPLGRVDPTARRRFLRDGEAVEGVALSRREGESTRLAFADVALSDWLPGTVRRIYDARAGAGRELAREVAIKEHVALRASITAGILHPRMVSVIGELAFDARTPLTAQPVAIEASSDAIEVRDAGAPRLDVSPVVSFWRDWFGVGAWPVEDLYYALIERFVGAFHVEAPDALAALRGRGVLYLANHQVGIESLLFSIVASALQGVPTLTLAKNEHRQSWLGGLIAHCFTWPGIEDPGVITYFDRADPASLPRIANELKDRAAARSLMVHVEGTRAQSCRAPVTKMSGIFCDLAINADVPIVPVRFSGGLPVETAPDKLEYPVGMGRQDYWLGRPIHPLELSQLPYKDRAELVMARINGLGPSSTEETPSAPDPAFEARVNEWIASTGTPLGLAALARVLEDARDPSREAARLVSAMRGGELAVGAGEREAWLAGLARMLFGPRGPRVVEG